MRNMRHLMFWRGDERGAALGLVIASALVCSIASYYILRLAVSQSMGANFFQGRAESRYLAEAALVWATQKLAVDPTYCGSDVRLDTNGDGVADANDAPTITVKVSNCTGNSHVLSAKASY